MTPEGVLAELGAEFEKRSAPYAHKPSALLALLNAVQETYGCISPEAGAAVSRFLGVGANRVHEAVTFYSLYGERPRGKYHLRICRTLSCHICGSFDLAEAVERKLGLRPGQVSADGLFSLETVECLGCCEKAPVVQVNLGEYRGPMTAESLSALIDELFGKERRDTERRDAGRCDAERGNGRG